MDRLAKKATGTGQAREAIRALSNAELVELWHKAHSASAMGALAHLENELIRRVRVLAGRRKDTLDQDEEETR